MTKTNLDDVQNFEACTWFAARHRAIKFLIKPWRLGYSKVIEKIANATGKGIEKTATTFWGDSFNVMFPERVSISIYRYGFFEENLTRIFLEHVKPGMVFFDVGAHFGYYSLLASRLIGAKGKVVSFEPTPSTFDMLRKNTASKSNISVVNAAAFSKDDELLKFTDFGVEFSAFNSVFNGKLSGNQLKRVEGKHINVKAITLDNYIYESKLKPDFMKIDAEGAELDILKGMKSTLEKIRPMITLEVGDVPGAENDTKSRQAVDFLINHNYRCMEYRDKKLVEHVVKFKYLHDNLLFIPR